MKNRLLNAFIAMGLIFLGVFVTSLVLVMKSNVADSTKYILVSFIGLLIFINLVSPIIGMTMLKRRREQIKRSFDNYVENATASAGVGMLIYNDSLEIIWTSDFIEGILNRKIIGKKLPSLSEDFIKMFNDGKTDFKFDSAGIVLSAQVDFNKKMIVFKDVTNEDMVMKQYVAEKMVVGELEIDNLQQLQTILAEEELFKVQSKVIEMLDRLADKYNLTYRQYVNGKYIIYTNQDVLDKLIAKRFNFFDEIRSVKIVDGITLSASLGVGYGSSAIKELNDFAKDGLRQALARGGDQIAIIEPNKRPTYFGSKTEGISSSSRVKIKKISSLLEEKLKSKDIKKVIVYGHVFADLDAVGSALGIAHLAREFKKDVYIQNDTFDSTTEKAIRDLMPKDSQSIFIKKSKATKLTAKKDTLVVVVDTAETTRIENEKALSNVNMDNVFIFDHHRVSMLPEEISSTNTYIDTTASSASEIVTEVLQFVSRAIKLPKYVSQMLLNGIYLDSKQFTKSVSSRTFAAAAWLERYGATATVASDILKLPEEHSGLISSILSSVKEVKPGYFVSAYEGDVPQDIISLAADEILRVQDRKAAFVIARIPGTRKFKMSARGNATNVQVIAEAVGGGGHFAASAAVSAEPIRVFEDNIVQSIVSIKEDK